MSVKRLFRVIFVLTVALAMVLGSSYAQTFLAVRVERACCTSECSQTRAAHKSAKPDQHATCSACCVGAAALFVFSESEKVSKSSASEERWELAQMYAPARVEKPLLPPPRA